MNWQLRSETHRGFTLIGQKYHPYVSLEVYHLSGGGSHTHVHTHTEKANRLVVRNPSKAFIDFCSLFMHHGQRTLICIYSNLNMPGSQG